MDANPRGFLGSIPLPTIFLAGLSLVGGWLHLQNDVASTRPDQEALQPVVMRGAERVPARLWQDPLEAVLRQQDDNRSFPSAFECWRDLAIGNADSAGKDQEHLAPQHEKILEAIDSGPIGQFHTEIFSPELRHIHYILTEGRPVGDPVLIMPVLLPGEPYAEDRERRIRTRIATGFALQRAGYRPEKANRIGRFSYRFDDKFGGQEVTVPWEWHEPDPARIETGRLTYKNVLVLWLNSNWFTQSPVRDLDRFLRAIGIAVQPRNAGAWKPVYSIIGPPNTESLAGFFKEMATSRSNGDEININRRLRYEVRESRVDWETICQTANRLLSDNQNPDDPQKSNDQALPRANIDHETIREELRRFSQFTEEVRRSVLGPGMVIETFDGLNNPTAVIRGSTHDWIEKAKSGLDEVKIRISKDLNSESELFEKEFLEQRHRLLLLLENDDDWEERALRHFQRSIKTELHYWASQFSSIQGDILQSQTDSNTMLGELFQEKVEAAERRLWDEYLESDWNGKRVLLHIQQARKLIDDLDELADRHRSAIAAWQLRNVKQKPHPTPIWVVNPTATTDWVWTAIPALAPDAGSQNLDHLRKTHLLPDIRKYLTCRAYEGLKQRSHELKISSDAELEHEFISTFSGKGQNSEARLFEYRRVTPNDVETARALVDELVLRAAMPSEDGHMLLISESDTLFGRALPLSVLQAIMHELPEEAPSELKERVSILHYMRGLDGKLPGLTDEQHIASDTADQEQPDLTQLAAGFSAIPQGTGQLDAIQRIPDLDHHLRGLNARKITSIGVLGSDIHDKLSIISILRNRFPEATIFTTDLHALMFHDLELPFTKNLVVASGHGLQVRGDLQGEIPPFRTSYQSSIFAAVLTALDRSKLANFQGSPPHVYEIGRGGPVLLNHITTAPRSNDHRIPAEKNSKGDYVAIVGSLLAVLFGMMVYGLHRMNRMDDRRLKEHLLFCRYGLSPGIGWRCGQWYLLFLLGSLSILLWVWWALTDNADGQGEPWSLVDGISVWPSILVRWMGFLVALFLIGLQIQAMRTALVRIAYDFGLEVPKRLSVEKIAYFKTRSRPRPFLETDEERQTRAQVNKAWLEFADKNPLKTVLLCLAAGLLLCGTGIGIVAYFGFPNVPARGDSARIAHGLSLVFTVPALAGLLIWSLCASCHVYRLIKRIGSDDFHWPPTCPIWAKHLGSPQHRKYKGSTLNILLIAKVTEMVSPLVVYPFIVLTFLLISRSAIFDSWVWSAPLGVVVLGFFALTVSAAVTMRVAAERLRQRTLREIKREVLMLLPGKEDSNLVDAYQELKEEIGSIKRGAFSPLSRNPVVIGVLTPFGGVGLLALVEMLATSL